ncbi:hypothetical protein [Streptomyces sp. SID13726]|uniref:hypothetical protein n=1 Tax=Streptomyces sp. SID13726 TaxID=2706058 RepID=UPI0013BD22BD|nr:hypothetical protein [Streptomyces sp. SID13726]NEB04500.1 hypothetical protein [Streptomyces sp. SID13726]
MTNTPAEDDDELFADIVLTGSAINAARESGDPDDQEVADIAAAALSNKHKG